MIESIVRDWTAIVPDLAYGSFWRVCVRARELEAALARSGKVVF